MTIDLEVLTDPGNLIASVVSGVLIGLYLVIFHPVTTEMNTARRALAQGFAVGFLGFVWYSVRIAVATYTADAENEATSDVPRLLAAMLLFLLFAVFVGVGAWLGYRVRLVRLRRRIRRQMAAERGVDSAR